LMDIRYRLLNEKIANEIIILTYHVEIVLLQ
jgi:hypothetical protein